MSTSNLDIGKVRSKKEKHDKTRGGGDEIEDQINDDIDREIKKKRSSKSQVKYGVGVTPKKQKLRKVDDLTSTPLSNISKSPIADNAELMDQNYFSKRRTRLEEAEAKKKDALDFVRKLNKQKKSREKKKMEKLKMIDHNYLKDLEAIVEKRKLFEAEKNAAKEYKKHEIEERLKMKRRQRAKQQ